MPHLVGEDKSLHDKYNESDPPSGYEPSFKFIKINL